VISLLNVVVGGGLLVAGRRLFWLLVGAIGFLIGLEVARRITFPSQLILILVALGLGVIFALMAVFLESVAIAMAGFLGGGLALMRIASMLGFDTVAANIVAFVLGGILGAILIVWLFNWALVTISSIAGASMIVSGLPLRTSDRPLLFLGLVILGVLIQALSMRREAAPEKTKPA
jgi:hypothetical protein